MARLALSGGADLIQFRNKKTISEKVLRAARALRELARRYEVPFIVNDNVGLAVAVDADGLHIGQGDVDARLAKGLMGEDKLIGVSITNYGQAVKAKKEGADYLGVGPIFKTPIKKDIRPKGLKVLKKIKRLNIPFFAIGGINLKNISTLIRSGFTNVAVIRGISKAKDPYIATKKLKEAVS